MKVNKFCAHIKTRNLLVCCVLSVDFKTIAAIYFFQINLLLNTQWLLLPPFDVMMVVL